MKMTVTHGYLIQLANLLSNPERIFSGPCSGEVGYKVFMNRNTAKVYLDGYVQAFPIDPKWSEYTQKHDAIYYANKVVTNDDLAALPEDKQKEITAQIAAIDAEYKDTIEKEMASRRERDKMLAEEVEVDLYTVTPEEIHIEGPDAWKIWTILFNEGKGFIRKPVTQEA